MEEGEEEVNEEEFVKILQRLRAELEKLRRELESLDSYMRSLKESENDER